MHEGYVQPTIIPSPAYMLSLHLFTSLGSSCSAKDDQSEDDKLCTLIESLQTPFSQQSKELLGDVADTLVPAVNSVKRAYHALNEESDVTYGSGLLLIDEACKKVEAVTIRQQDAVTDEYQASQVC